MRLFPRSFGLVLGPSCGTMIRLWYEIGAGFILVRDFNPLANQKILKLNKPLIQFFCFSIFALKNS